MLQEHLSQQVTFNFPENQQVQQETSLMHLKLIKALLIQIRVMQYSKSYKKKMTKDIIPQNVEYDRNLQPLFIFSPTNLFHIYIGVDSIISFTSLSSFSFPTLMSSILTISRCKKSVPNAKQSPWKSQKEEILYMQSQTD